MRLKLIFIAVLYFSSNLFSQEISILINEEKCVFDSCSISLHTTVTNYSSNKISFYFSALSNVKIEPSGVSTTNRKCIIYSIIKYLGKKKYKRFISIKKGESVSFQITKRGYYFKKGQEYKLHIAYKNKIVKKHSKNTFIGEIKSNPIYFKIIE